MKPQQKNPWAEVQVNALTMGCWCLVNPLFQSFFWENSAEANPLLDGPRKVELRPALRAARNVFEVWRTLGRNRHSTTSGTRHHQRYLDR